MKTISVVTSAYNESESIEELARRLRKAFDELSGYQCEAIIVDNGSVDDSFAKLRRIHRDDTRFKVVRLSRNFVFDEAITAGLRYATSDAAIIMTAALKEPPELFKDFIAKWEEGYAHVYGIVKKRPGTTFMRKINSQMFYWIIHKLTAGMIPKNVSDFRLVDRTVYQVITQMNERGRFLRGMFAWVGFKSIGIEFERAPRFRGQSKAYTLPVLNHAFKAICAFSTIPLRIISLIGLLVSLFSFVSLALIFLRVLVWGVPFPGFGTIMAVMLLMFGFLFTALGVVAEYIGLIYSEVKQRPSFVVEETLGL